MREIKFRAWDKRFMLMWYSEENQTVWAGGAEISVNTNNGKLYGEFIGMQFTGLKDNNGKEIYEGDIVEVVDRKTGIVREGERGIVEWRGCEFVCVSLPPDDWDPMSPCFNPMLAPLIVIGNRYENPELLK